MVVTFAVERLLLCEWSDALGREHRETFAPEQLELVETSIPLWIRAVTRLSERWSVVALCLNELGPASLSQ
jgi:hypothetical protein